MTGTNGTETQAAPSTLAEARDLMLQHEARANIENYRIGRVFNHVVDKGLAGAWTTESARRYFGPRIKAFSPSTLQQYGTVAREFSEEICRKYGLHPLHLLLFYAKKHNISLTGKDPGLMLIRVPCEDGTVLRKPFVDCSREELGRALTGVLLRESGSPPRADLYCLQLLRDGLRKRFEEEEFPRVTASVREGRIHITLKTVSVEDLEPLAGAILESLEALHEERYRRPLTQRPSNRASNEATALRAP